MTQEIAIGVLMDIIKKYLSIIQCNDTATHYAGTTVSCDGTPTFLTYKITV